MGGTGTAGGTSLSFGTPTRPGPASPGPDRSSGSWRRWLSLILALAILGVVIALVLRVPSAASDFVAAFEHFRLSRLPWLAVAAGLETLSLACGAQVHRMLLRAGGVTVPFATMLGLTVASTAVVDLVPAGVAPASGWLVEQYRARDAPVSLGLWTVLAAGFVATVSALALLLVGAGIAGIWTPLGLGVAMTVLVAGSAGFVLGTHRLARWDRWLTTRLKSRLSRAVARTVERATQCRAGVRGGASVLVYSTFNWLFDGACLVLAFVLVGYAVPWRGVLFAYAASQVAGGLSFLPAGIGAVEGSLVGALLLTGTPAAHALVATLIYRVIAYWVVAGIGAVVFVVQTRRERARQRAREVDTHPSRT